MVRSLWVFNLLLMLLSLGLLSGLAHSLLDHQALGGAPHQAYPPAQGDNKHGEQTISVKPSRQSLSDFDVIVRRDPFNPPVSPPVIRNPKEKSPVKSTPKARARPIFKKPAPPVELPSLMGVFIVGEERKAILKDGERQDLYRLGQSVGGGILTKIEADRVEITRGNTTEEVFIKSAVPTGRLKTRPPSQQDNKTVSNSVSPPASSVRSSRLSRRLGEQQRR